LQITEELFHIFSEASPVAPSALVIPFGRSLQKNKADFINPRIIANNQSIERPLFLGYAPTANQIEVISWNPISLRFDFEIVKDYGPGTKSYVVTPDRNFCVEMSSRARSYLLEISLARNHYCWHEQK